MNSVRMLLLPVGPLHAAHAFLASRGMEPLRDAAELLVAYAEALAGRPYPQ